MNGSPAMVRMKDFAVRIAREAGALMRSSFRSGLSHRIKPDGSFVTDVDDRINALVIERVKARFPTHDVYGEESSARSGSEYVWVCDPIDGTNAFAHNVPTFVFSLALTRAGRPVLGVIYDPMLERLYEADETMRSKLNDQPISVSPADSIRGTLIGACMLHSPFHDLLVPIGRLIEAGGHVQNYGSIAYSAMLVASGEMSCAIYPGTNGHDIAAARIIIERAGGRVTSFSNADQRYDGTIDGAIMSNGKVHDEIMRVVAGSAPR
jgi:myo-inositol-1(or 4)-monophosphatase